MQRTSPETLDEVMIPVYFAVEPRDPRDGQGMGEVSNEDGPRTFAAESFPHLAPCALEEVLDALTVLGIPAQIVDGVEYGWPGWVMGRSLAWQDGRVLRVAPDENAISGPYPTLTAQDVTYHLARLLNTTVHIFDDPLDLVKVPGSARRDDSFDLAGLGGQVSDTPEPVIVTTLSPSVIPSLAYLTETAVWWTDDNGWRLITGISSEHARTIATFSETVIFLERTGPWSTLGLMADGRIVTEHQWGPRWTQVDPLAAQDVSLEPDDIPSALELVELWFESPKADIRSLMAALRLPAKTLPELTELFAAVKPDDPFTQFLRIAGCSELLSTQAAEVASGWRAPEDVSDARLAASETLSETVVEAVLSMADADTRTAAMARFWAQRSKLVVLTAGVLSVCALGVAVGVTRKLMQRKN